MYDMVVVGGGHNGVITASILSRHGFKVLLVEANPWLGGLAGGPPSGLPASLFAYAIGLVPKELDEWLGLLDGILHRPDPSWVDVEEGEIVFRWWRSRRRLYKEAAEAGIEGLPDLLDLMDRFWRCYKKLGLYYTPKPPSPSTAASILDTCDPETATVVESSVEDLLRRYLPRRWWDLVIYHTLWQANGFTLAYYLQNMGVWDQPVGGMRSLSRRLEGLARSSGVDLLLGSRVEDLAVSGGKVAGVVIDGGKVIRARRGVVYSAPLASIERLPSSHILGDRELRRLRRISRSPVRVIRVDYISRRRPQPPREDGWNGYPIISHWTRGSGAEYTYPSLYSSLELHLIQASGLIEDPGSMEVPGVGERDILAWWARGPGVQRACCMNTSGHPDHIPMTGDSVLDGRPIPEWSSYTMGVEGLYHSSASSYPGGEINGVAGVNAAIRVMLDNRVEPRIPLPWARDWGRKR